MSADISNKIQSILKKKLKKISITVASETSKLLKLRIESADRIETKKQTAVILNKLKYKLTDAAESSIGAYDIKTDSATIRLLFKNTSGGMSETTLNSTITELVPAILFVDKKTELFVNYKKAWNYLVDHPNDKVYIGNDAKAGNDFIKKMPDSSKFKEKMTNAKGITKYLKKLDSEKKINNLYWGYRGKPIGVNNKHKGDLFVEFVDGKLLGVSLKAGTGKTEEPKLNTYVNAVLENLKAHHRINKLKKKIYKKIHSQIGLPENWSVRSHLSEIVTYRKHTEQKLLDAQYDDMLEMCRSTIIDAFNSNVKNTINFIKEQIVAEQEGVPLVVVKGLNNGSYQILTEEDELNVFLPKVKRVKAYKNVQSKQNWHIDLIGTRNTLTLNMSIRTNKSKPFNKLAQGYNLAIKFNSLKMV